MEELLKALPWLGKVYDAWRSSKAKTQKRFALEFLRGLKPTEFASAQAIFDLAAAQVSGRLFKSVEDVDDVLLSLQTEGIVEYEPIIKMWHLRSERPVSLRYPPRW